jgi:hypothetical protein
LDQAQKLRSHEIETGRRLEQRLGRKIYESVHEGADFVDEIGKTYDAVGGGKRAARHFKWSEYKRTIARHLRKSVDYVVIDLTGFSESQIQRVREYLLTLPDMLRSRIVPIGFNL